MSHARRRACVSALALLSHASCYPTEIFYPPPTDFGISGYGDSLMTGGAILPAADVSYLAHVPPEWSTSNRAVYGEQLVHGTRRLAADVPTLVERDVEVVVLMWGTNDVYSPFWEEGPGGTRDTMLASLADVLDALTSAGVAVVVAFPPPTLDDSETGIVANLRMEELVPLFAAVAEDRGARFVDLRAAVLAHPEPERLLPDGIHPGREGDAFLAAALEPAIRPAYDAWLAESGSDP